MGTVGLAVPLARTTHPGLRAGRPRTALLAEALAGPAGVGGCGRSRVLSSCPAGIRDLSSPGLRVARVSGARAARRGAGGLQGRLELGGLAEPLVREGGVLDRGARGPGSAWVQAFFSTQPHLQAQSLLALLC